MTPELTVYLSPGTWTGRYEFRGASDRRKIINDGGVFKFTLHSDEVSFTRLLTKDMASRIISALSSVLSEDY